MGSLFRLDFGSLGIAFAAFIFIALAAPPAWAGNAAETFVQELANEAMAIINDDALSARQKKAQMSDILDANIDIEGIALFTLGQYRKTATPAEIEDYVPMFRLYLIEFYIGKLSQYEGMSFTVTGSHDYGGQKGTVVTSDADVDGDTTEINWRVLNNSSIMDVEIEGVWMALDLREQLVSVIDQNHGRVSAATERLKEIVEGG
jgi:phospholipid transport system substrate-binding protein